MQPVSKMAFGIVDYI